MISLLETHPYYTLVALIFGSIILIYRELKNGQANPKGLPLPPGPKGYPLLGNLFDMPVDRAWLVYNDWYKTYGKTFTSSSYILINSWVFLGDIIYFNVLGQHFIILNSLESTTELFERRSTNYSGRMRMTMLNELHVSDPFHPKNILKFLFLTEWVGI